MRRLWLIMALFAAPFTSAAQTSLPSLLQQAERHYSAGDFDAAAAAYEQAIPVAAQTRQLHGGLFYNLGNCYYRLQQPVMALLQYQRAHAFMGNDRDLLANIEIVAHLLRLEQGLPPQSALTKIFFWLPFVPLPLLWQICLWLYVAIGALALLRLRWPTQLRNAWFGTLLLGILLGASLCASLLHTRRPYGMVMHGGAELRSGKGAEFIVTLNLPAGTNVRVLETDAQWWKIETQVQTPQGVQPARGFVPAAQMQPLAIWQILRGKNLSALFSKENSPGAIDNDDHRQVK